MWFAFRAHHAEPQRLFDKLIKADFKSASMNCRQTLVNALDLLDHAPQLGFAHFRQHLILRHKLRKLTPKKLTDKRIRRIERLLTQYRQIEHSKKYSDLLDSGAFWEKLFDATRNNLKTYQQVMQLSGQWLRESHYAHYSTADLLSVYQTVLPLFANWLNYAKKEFAIKRTRLSTQVATEYVLYLNGLTKELKMEERKVRQSFQRRLEVGAEHHDWRFDQLVLAFIEKLQQLVGALLEPNSSGFTSGPSHLTADQFESMHQIIAQEGDAEEKAALSQLPYYPGMDLLEDKPLNPLGPYRRNHKKYLYQIPSSLASELPIELPYYLNLPDWLHWIFTEAKIRYLFFQEPHCQMVLASVNAFAPFTYWRFLEVPPEEVKSHHRWVQFKEMLSDLKRERERAEKVTHTLSPIFHYSTYSLLKTYQNWLHTQAKQILTQQLQQLTTYLNTQIKQARFTSNHNIHIDLLIDAIEVQNRNWHAELELEIIQLRLKTADWWIQANAFSNLSNSSLSSTQKENTRKILFHQLYTDLYQLIATYERTQPFLSVTYQSHLKALKDLLKASEAQQSPLQLRNQLQTYRHTMETDRVGSVKQLIYPDSDLAGKIDELLKQPAYQDTQLMTEELENCFTNLSSIENKLTPETISNDAFVEEVAETHLLDWIKNPLEKSTDELNQDMDRLASSKSEYYVFRYQAHNYIHRLVTALSLLSSEASFKVKAPQVQCIIEALLRIGQGTPLTLSYLLHPLQEAQDHLNRNLLPREEDDWPFIVQVYFEPIMQELTQLYGELNDEIRSNLQPTKAQTANSTPIPTQQL